MEDEDFDFSVMGPTGGFAVDGMEQSPLAGASLFDSAAESIRAARLGPMAQQAGGAYASQAGGLHSLVDRLSARKQSQRSPLARRYAEGGEVEIDEEVETQPYLMASRRAENLARLEQQYKAAQPSDSEKWLSVAAALLSPTETGKTTESLAKALGVFGQYAGENRKFAQAKAGDIASMLAKYDIAEGNQAVRMAAAQAAADKAKRPKYQFDEYNQTWVQVPGTGGVPDLPQPGEGLPVVTDETSYAAVGIGKQYVDDKGNIRTRTK